MHNDADMMTIDFHQLKNFVKIGHYSMQNIVQISSSQELNSGIYNDQISWCHISSFIYLINYNLNLMDYNLIDFIFSVY